MEAAWSRAGEQPAKLEILQTAETAQSKTNHCEWVMLVDCISVLRHFCFETGPEVAAAEQPAKLEILQTAETAQSKTNHCEWVIFAFLF